MTTKPEGDRTTKEGAAVSRGTVKPDGASQASSTTGQETREESEDSGPREIPTDVERDAQGTLKYDRQEDATAAALLRERHNARAAEDSDRVSQIEDEIRKLGYRVPTEGESEDRTAEQDSPAQRTATR